MGELGTRLYQQIGHTAHYGRSTHRTLDPRVDAVADCADDHTERLAAVIYLPHEEYAHSASAFPLVQTPGVTDAGQSEASANQRIPIIGSFATRRWVVSRWFSLWACLTILVELEFHGCSAAVW